MAVDILLGLQWGDEGKGKIVDLLSRNYDIVARFQGGPNAGHTLIIGDKKYVFHTLPSGVIHKNVKNVIGSGMVIDPITLKMEIDKLSAEGLFNKENLLISKGAHLILPTHRILDKAQETSKGAHKIGSTLKGIGPAYVDKMGRAGVRMGDLQTKGFREKYEKAKEYHLKHLQTLNYSEEPDEKTWFEAIEFIKGLNFLHTELYLQEELKKGKSVLAEGAQGSLLDVSFGTYPYVTSSHTIAASCCIGLGIPPKNINKIIGVFKAYTTRVGEGPFPTELEDGTGEALRKKGHEFGSTTGRPRRCGWLDLPALKYAIDINGVNELVITKIDVLSGLEEIKCATNYKDSEGTEVPYPYLSFDSGKVTPDLETMKGWEDDIFGIKDKSALPEEVFQYLNFIEKEIGQKIKMISTGPERNETITV